MGSAVHGRSTSFSEFGDPFRLQAVDERIVPAGRVPGVAEHQSTLAEGLL
jgi:hypothetical protein